MRPDDYEPNSDHHRVAMAAQQGRTRLWVPYLIALVILGAAYVWGAVVYDQLPAMLPTGWGPDGEVRGWTEKSFGSPPNSSISGPLRPKPPRTLSGCRWGSTTTPRIRR